MHILCIFWGHSKIKHFFSWGGGGVGVEVISADKGLFLRSVYKMDFFEGHA